MEEPIGGDDYFALCEPFSTKFAALTFEKMKQWQVWIEETGLDARWAQNIALYQGADPKRFNNVFDRESFKIMGENGELLYCMFNELRNLIQHILNMTVSQPPNMVAKAINDDSRSLTASQKYDGVFSYYMSTYKSGRLLRQAKSAVENCLVADVGYILCEWDPMLGKPIDVMTDENGEQQHIYEGDLYFKARSVYDVFFDPGVEDEEEREWVVVRDQINKYQLAKRFPKWRREIEMQKPQTSGMLTWRRGFMRPPTSDIIDVFKLYVEPSKLLPQGRRALFLNSDICLLDEPNPYEGLPVFSVRAMEGLWSVFGFAPANMLAPVQAALNVLTSAMMTNYAMFGTQNVAVQATDDFDVQTLAGGMNIVKYQQTPPMPINLAQQSDGIMQFYEILRKIGEVLSGVNSVQRGDPEHSLKSGVALGIVQAAAVQFQSALSASFVQLMQNVGNHMLYCFRKFIKAERTLNIIGEDQLLQEIKVDADAFEPINRVTAEIMDPAMRTLGYKTDLGWKLVESGLIKTPQELITVITTGQLKPLYRGMQSQLNLIHQENDDMIKGRLPNVIETDDDDLHIAEHSCITASPKIRYESLQNGQVVPGSVLDVALKHNAMHEQNKVSKSFKSGMMQEAAGAPFAPHPAPQQAPAQAQHQQPGQSATPPPRSS